MALESLKISKPSKRTAKAITKASKALRRDLEEAHKHQSKKNATKAKTTRKKASPKKRVLNKSGATK